jgi:hypothetical protein
LGTIHLWINPELEYFIIIWWIYVFKPSLRATILKMAIAVAPVTNWRFYDSIYTEKMLQTPQENAVDMMIINYVDGLKRKIPL